MIAAASDANAALEPKKRIKEEDEAASSAKRAKFERSFVPSWLEKYDWLRYDSDNNFMYCGLCVKYQKSNAFTEGCQNFRRDNLNKHINTNDHKVSCRQENGTLAQRPLSACSLGNSSTASSHPCNGADQNCSASSSNDSSSQSEDTPRSPTVPLSLSQPASTSRPQLQERSPSPIMLKEPLPFFSPTSSHLPLSMSFFPRPPFPFHSYPKHLRMFSNCCSFKTDF
jgi:hypothetical protein